MFLLPKVFLEIKEVPNTKMVKSRGVFAKKDIPGGLVIGDYLGMVTAQEDEDESKYGTYYMTYSSSSSIYADPKLSGVHIINNSCMPNCGTVEHKTHILYYSLRKIFKGEELTVKYDLGIPTNDCNPCTHQCYCGTPLCTGSTHSAEPDDEEVEEDSSIYMKPGKQLPALNTYPKTIRDAAPDNLYASLKHKSLTYNSIVLPPLRIIKKLIRETGRILYIPEQNISIYGLHDNFILSKIKNPAK